MPWLSLHALLLSRGDGHLLPRCHAKIKSKASSCAPSLCPTTAAPWEGSTLCHVGWILLSLYGTAATNKGLSSAITPWCPGSALYRVGAGMRAWGWHRYRGESIPMLSITPRMAPCTQYHPGSITQGHGDCGDTTYPLCPGWRGPCCSPACSPGARGQAAAEVGGCSGGGISLSCSLSSWSSRCACPPLHAVSWEGVCPPHLPHSLWDTLTCTRAVVQGVALGTSIWDQRCPRPGLHGHRKQQPWCQQL